MTMNTTHRLTSRLRLAAQELCDRQARKTHPAGNFDNAGKFYLASPLPCCAGIRQPTRGYPYSLNSHARSIPHVAAEFGYALSVLRGAITRIVKERKLS